MKYLKKTIEYLFVLEKGKRMLVLFLLALPMGISFAFVSPNYVLLNWLKNYSVGNQNFWQAWNFYGQIKPIEMLIATIATFITTFFSYSIMTTVISRSMRVGMFKVNNLFYEANENFFAIFSFTIIAFIGGLIFKALSSLFFTLWQGVHSLYLSMVLSIITLILLICLLCFIFTYICLFLPYMSINGLKFKDAIAESIGRFGKKQGKSLFISILIPVLLGVLFGTLAGLSEYRFVGIIVDSISYAFLSVYLLTLAFVAYYKIEGLERKDYTKEYFYKNTKGKL
ncbi:MAG TPA: hypothetical protein GX709_05165 [Clostridiales bacterium]|nr:hypothetical protein [Clostridiales bacterium]